jgi:RimJ/RimL family protein N-acetyltransferase
MIEDVMDIQKQLFVGDKINLGPIDHENDPQIISNWSHNSEYLRLLDVKPAMPISAGQAKKMLEALEQEMEQSKTRFYFTIRAREDDRLLGFAEIRWIEWSHGNGWIRLGIGDRQERGKGYGSEALGMLLRYAFHELNFYRLSAEIASYGEARRLFEGQV